MTRDDIIRMAREAMHERFSEGGYWINMEVKDLERFAALVAAAEQTKLEPVGVMQESCVMEGLVIPVVTQELPVGTPLYAALVTAETGKEIAALREENERLREAIRELMEAEASPGGARGGFIKRPASREHEARVQKAWMSLEAALRRENNHG